MKGRPGEVWNMQKEMKKETEERLCGVCWGVLLVSALDAIEQLCQRRERQVNWAFWRRQSEMRGPSRLLLDQQQPSKRTVGVIA